MSLRPTLRARRSKVASFALAVSVVVALLGAGMTPSAAEEPDAVPAFDRAAAEVEATDVRVLPGSVEFTLDAAADGQGWVPSSVEMRHRGPSPVGGDTDHTQRVSFTDCAISCSLDISIPRTTIGPNSWVLLWVIYRHRDTSSGDSVMIQLVEAGHHDWAPVNRPTAIITSPLDKVRRLGDVTVTVDAAPGASALKGVRFYSGLALHPFDPKDYTLDTEAPYETTVTMDGHEDMVVQAVAEDMDGNLSISPGKGANYLYLYTYLIDQELVGQTFQTHDEGMGFPLTSATPRIYLNINAGGNRGGTLETVHRVELIDDDGTVLDTQRPVDNRQQRWQGALSAAGTTRAGWHDYTVRLYVDRTQYVDHTVRRWWSGGVSAPRVSVGGRSVGDVWLTAGTTARLTAALTPRMVGDTVTSWGLIGPLGRELTHTGACAFPTSPDKCSAVVNLRHSWPVPKTPIPGARYVMEYWVGAGGKDAQPVAPVLLKVRPAGKVNAAKVKPVGRGKRATVRGTVRLKYSGDRVSRSRAKLQYRAKGGTWRTVATVRSDHRGIVRARPKVKRGGHFRWVLADAGGKHSGATSTPVKVTVRKR